MDGKPFIGGTNPSIADIRLASTLEFLASIDYKLPGWAKEYMTAFPDMVVRMDSVKQEGDQATFHWTWTGTNTGPGGTGKTVRISGYEIWTMGPDGLIVESKGHFDETEYQRQLRGDGERR